MPKRRVLSGAQVCKILVLNGFEEKRRKGSHRIMQKRVLGSSGKYATITVPVPDHKELRAGTLGEIIRQSKLPKRLFN